jgi:hypothetical protein
LVLRFNTAARQTNEHNPRLTPPAYLLGFVACCALHGLVVEFRVPQHTWIVSERSGFLPGCSPRHHQWAAFAGDGAVGSDSIPPALCLPEAQYVQYSSVQDHA